MVIVKSFPMILNATCETTSGITGFTFPGIIDEPFCIAGRLISEIPVLGPLDNNLKSFAIFERLTAHVFNTPDTVTKPSKFCVASIKSLA